MNYLKTYEKYHRGTIKRYIVWHEYDSTSWGNKNLVDILRTDKKTNSSLIKVKVKYEYNLKKEKKQKPEADHYQYIDPSEDMDYVMFTSDSLEECKNFVNIYVNSIKYNI